MVADAKLMAIEEALKQIGKKIKEELPPDVGFCLLLFDLGQDEGNVAYISDSQRADVLSALETFLERLQRRT